VYEQARVFVAPTRFAAGIPLKLCEAAAHGVPIVATSLLARQLGWHPETHLLTADTAEEFAAQCVRLYHDHDLWRHLRTNALRAVQADFDSTSFSDTVQTMLQDALEMSDIVPSGPPERPAQSHIWARDADAA
jgi:glycosyltransferase involved in cell wall biosynthesis